MNVVELMTVVSVPTAGLVAYKLASPFGVAWGALASLAGALSGLLLGPFLGILFILPFEGASRSVRFLMTGRWTDPNLWQHNRRGPNEHIESPRDDAL